MISYSSHFSWSEGYVRIGVFVLDGKELHQGNLVPETQIAEKLRKEFDFQPQTIVAGRVEADKTIESVSEFDETRNRIRKAVTRED